MFKYAKDGQVELDAKMLLVPEFRKIYDRDHSRGKGQAKKELAFVYFMADYKSEYNAYGVEKEEQLCRDIMQDEKYRPDEMVMEAIRKYEELQKTYSMRYLISIRETIDSLVKYYEDLRYDPATGDASIYDPSVVLKGTKDIEVILEKIEKWERKVFQEEESMTIRGGGIAGIFEDKQNAPWLKN